jgi:hypothetical protein
MIMKKVFLLVLIGICCGPIIIHAQSFQKGTNIISAGIGLGSSLGNFTSSSSMPAFSLQYERGVWDIGGPGVISLGGYAGIKNFKYSGKSGEFSYSEKWNYTIIGIRSAYHYNGIKSDKLDVYGGIMLSYNILSFHYEDNSGNSNTFDNGNYGSAAGFTLYIGGRYFFSPNIGAFAELGYGVSYLTLGLAFKF